MKPIIQIVIIFVIPIAFYIQPVLAQKQTKIAADNVQKSILLEEADVVLVDNDNAVTVKAVLGRKEHTDLKQGDIIFMAQGLPVASVSNLITLYDKTGKGGEFRMAVKREDEKFLTSFNINPSSSTGKEMFTGTMKFNSAGTNSGSSDLIPELLVYGFMAAGSDNGLIIKQTMPNLDPGLKNKGISNGDSIVSIGGKKVNTHKEFKQVWDKIPEGEMVELNIVSGEEKVSVSLSKKNVNGKILFKNKDN